MVVAKKISQIGSFVEVNAPERGLCWCKKIFSGLRELFNPVSVSVVLVCDCTDLCVRV